MIKLVPLATDLLKYKIFKTSIPSLVVWSITNNCNLKCEYCGVKKGLGNILVGDELLNYLKKFIVSGTKMISLTGGEPLLHPDFPSFVKMCGENGVLLSLNTNGFLVPQKIELIKKYFYQVVVSLDGPRELNDAQRGTGSFDKTIYAIQALKANKVRVKLTSVLTPKSYPYLDEIIDLSKKLDIPINFQVIQENGVNETEDLFPVERCKDIVLDLLTRKRKNRKAVGNSTASLKFLSEQFKRDRDVNCLGGKFFCRIEPNGDLKMCGSTPQTVIYPDIKRLGIIKSLSKLTEGQKCRICFIENANRVNSY